MFSTAFLKLQFGIVIVWKREICTQAGHTMLVKLTTGESVDEDVVKISKKIRTHSSDSSDSDSDSSASQASFHIEQAEFVRKLDKPVSIEAPVIVRTVTNSNKSIERTDSVSTQSETESRQKNINFLFESNL